MARALSEATPSTYDRLVDVYSDHLATPVGETGKTLGDYFTEASKANWYQIKDHVFIKSEQNLPFLIGEPFQLDWEAESEGETVTVVLTDTTTDHYLTGTTVLSWIVPGKVIETNGEVHGKTITWDYSSGTRFYARFTRVDKDVLQALAANG